MSHQKIRPRAKKALSLLVTITTIIWSIGVPLGVLIPQATKAAISSRTVMPAFTWGAKVAVSSAATAMVIITIGSDGQGTNTLDAVTATFSGTGFATSDLAALANNNTSGVALYQDNTGAGTVGSFDSNDSLVSLPGTPSWSGSPATTVTLTAATPVNLSAGSNNFFVAIRTSGAISNNDQISATIATNGITTNPTGTVTALTTPPLVADTVALFLERVIFINATTVDAVFNEDLLSTSIATSDFTLTTAALSDNSAITSATLQPDNKTVRIMATGATIVASGTDSLVLAGAVSDIGGNTVSSGGGQILSGTTAVAISEVKTNGSGQLEFVELFNPGMSDINLNTLGLKLHTKDATGTDTNRTLTFVNNTIPAHGFFLIGPSSANVGATKDATYADADALIDNGSVYISTSGTADVAVIDKVGMGTQATGGFEMTAAVNPASATASIERKGCPSSTSTTMADAGTDANSGNSYDSNNNNFDFVARATASPQNSTSTAESGSCTGGGTGGANMAPTINHMPTGIKATGSSLDLFAQVGDDLTMMTNDKVQLYYCVLSGGTGCTALANYTSLNAVDIGTGYFRWTVPSTAFSNAANDVRYFIVANDGLLYRYFTASPTWDTTSSNNTAPATLLATIPSSFQPFLIDVTATGGSSSITGTVQDSSTPTPNPISSALVTAQGTGVTATSDNTGAFTLSNLPQGFFELVALKSGYDDAHLPGITSPKTGVVITMWASSGGLGGDTTKPKVVNSVPRDKDEHWPKSNAPIDIFFSEPMDTDITVIPLPASNGTNATNVRIQRMIPDGTLVPSAANTSLAGAWVWQNNTQLRFTPDLAASPPGLEAGRMHIITLTNNLKDTRGNRLEGNRPDGHALSFMVEMDQGFMFNQFMGEVGTFDANNTTMMTTFNTQMATSFGSGAFFPPFVKGSSPHMGDFNVKINTKILIRFSEALDSTTVNTTNILLKKFNPTTNIETTVSTTVALDSNNPELVVITPTANLDADSSYKVYVQGAVKSRKGATMRPPDQTTQEAWRSEFKTGTGSDLTAPTVIGGYPDNNATSISPLTNVIEISFAECLNPTNVTNSNVALQIGQTSVTASVEYDLEQRRVLIKPATALTPNTTYTISLNNLTDCTTANSSNGTAMTAALTRSFTVGQMTTAETTAASVSSAKADDYGLSITFSKPMNAATAIDTTNFSTSVLRLANYTLRSATPPTDPQSGTAITLTSATSAITIDWDAANNTVSIKGIKDNNWTAGKVFYVEVAAAVTDLAGTAIGSTRSARGPVENSRTTGGMLGPGMMGPPPMVTAMAQGGAMMPTGPMMTSDFGNWNAGDMRFKPVNVFPMNSMAGATSSYFVDVPITAGKEIDSGGTMVLTFPQGFGVSGAQKDINSPANKDINGPAAGTVTIGTDQTNATNGIAANVLARTITLTLVRSGGGNIDGFLHFELKGIVNSSTPKEFGTTGYTVDMQTKNSSGQQLESFTSMPFFIQKKGTNTINVTVALKDAAGSNVNAPSDTTINLFMGSPMSGPLDSTVTIASGSATATKTFSDLPDGGYHIFTEPNITVGSNQYTGSMTPEPIFVSGSQTATKTINFTQISTANAAPLVVLISGSFAATGESIDIFAGGPRGFQVTTKTLTGTVTNNSTTIYLPSDGVWSVGMGPAMPKGPMGGPPPMPDWMPPRPFQIQVTNASQGNNATMTEIDSGESNTTDKQISFAIPSANKLIVGRVINDSDGDNAYDSGEAITNAEVYAYQPQGFGGMGSRTKSDANDGTFTLKIAQDGTYVVNTYVPGMPEPASVTVLVTTTDGTTTVSINGQTSTGASGSNPLFLKMNKPNYTISGKVKDTSGGPIKYAPIFGQEATSKRVMNGGTDSNGNYTLFVDNGTWTLRSEMPYGTDACGSLTLTVTVSGASLSGQDITPSSSTCYKLSGTITISAARPLIPVFLEAWDTTNNRPSGSYHRNTMTDKLGAYEFKVAGNTTYKVGTFDPDYGEVGATFTITTADKTDANITVSAGDLKTLTVNYTGGTTTMTGFLESRNADGSRFRGRPIKPGELSGASPSLTLSLPADSYSVRTYIDGLGQFSSTANLTSSNATVTFNLSTTSLTTVSGNVKDATGTNIANASVTLINTSDNGQVTTTTNSSGNYSTQTKTGTYRIEASAENYIGTTPTTLSVSGATTSKDFSAANNNALTTTSKTITGTIYQSDGTTAVKEGAVWAEKSGGGFASAKINTDGSYKLPVTEGTWTVKANAPLHATTSAGATTISSSQTSVTKNNTLTANALNVTKSATSSLVASSGGSMDDTLNTGMKIQAPAGAFGKEGSNVDLTIKQATTAPLETPTNNALKTFEVTALKTTDSNNKKETVTQLSSDLQITVKYTDADVTAAAVSETALSFGYYDQTTKQWLSLKGTQDTTNNTFTAAINHLTPMGIIYPASAVTGGTTVSDTTAPKAPTGIQVSGANGKVTVTWTDPTDSDLASILILRDHNPIAGTVSGTAYATVAKAVKTYTDSNVTVGTTYKYILRARDTSNNTEGNATVYTVIVTAAAAPSQPTTPSQPSQPTTPTPAVEKKVEKPKEAVTPAAKAVEAIERVAKRATEIVKIKSEAALSALGKVADILSSLKLKRDTKEESKALKVIKRLLLGKVPSKTMEKDALVNFVSYGTETTKKLGSGERAGVVNSYKTAFGKAPATETEWEDAIKIANGRWPSQKNEKAENKAKETFKKIYLRDADMNNSADNAAVTIIAYGLRPASRNLNSEKFAITAFRAIFKTTPVTANNWDIVRAIANSGAKR